MRERAVGTFSQFESQPTSVQPPPSLPTSLPTHLLDADMPVDYEIPASMAADQQSALGMLAEASRRQRDRGQDGQLLESAGQEQGQGQGQQLAVEALLLQRAAAVGGNCPSPDKAVPQRSTVRIPPRGGEKIDFSALVTSNANSSDRPGDLRSVIRETENHQLDDEETQQQQPGRAIDPQLAPPSSTSFSPTLTQLDDFMVWNPEGTNGHEIFGSLSAQTDQPEQGYTLDGKQARKPQRGRFTDTRRQEVSKIRKRGACIRCRMLKKPCSEGTPCSTCANVETARLWKGICLRTKLVDEFTLWSTGLLQSHATTKVLAAVQGLEEMPLQGRLEVRTFQGSSLSMSFGLKQYSPPSNQHVLQQGTSMFPKGSGVQPTSVWVLDETNLWETIEQYVTRIAPARANCEKHRFFKNTLNTALDLMVEGQAATADGPGTLETKSGRSCYNLQDSLPKNVVDLWIATSLLVTPPEELNLDVRYNPSRAPLIQPESMGWSAETPDQALPPGESTFLIRAQLLAALESRCQKLSKMVINEVERRLLQRSQVSRFATFITCVLLLSAVERITHFYHAFSTPDGAFKPARGLTSWPLHTPPSRLWPQGEHLAALLVMLLRMRALPPSTLEVDGKLVAQQEYGQATDGNGKTPRELFEAYVRTAGEWLDPIQLEVEELVRSRDVGVEGSGDWDFRFLGMILLPRYGS